MRGLCLLFAVVLPAAMTGCRGLGARDESAQELERDFRDSERQIKETRTLSNLAKIEASIADYIKYEKRIPEKIDQLIPKYLAMIPTVEIEVSKHHESAAVKYYYSETLRDGQIDGTRLKDTGKWGYVHNERQVVVFVDCTHPSGRGKSWYQERGAQ